jgi:hypothetical protein
MSLFKTITGDAGAILALLAGLSLVMFVGLLGATILSRIWKNQINLSKLISEANGDASMSRLQLLIFTFVIAMSLFIIVVGNSSGFAFPSNFPPEVLTLLGISGTSYLVSKAIQGSGVKATLAVSAPPSTPVAAGANVVFTVSLLNAPSGAAIPPLTWSLDAPAHGNIVPGASGMATYTAPATSPGPGTLVKVRAQADGFEDGTVTITLA